jgi:hypothetical protein
LQGQRRYRRRIDGAEDSTLVDAESGVVASPLTEAAAVAIARTDREVSPAVIAVKRIERDPPIEYRGQPLPAWCISFGPLLVAFAVTGLVAVLSGWALWVVRLLRRWSLAASR